MDISNNGIQIGVESEGISIGPDAHSEPRVYIENQNGVLTVYIWDGVDTGNAPTHTIKVRG